MSEPLIENWEGVTVDATGRVRELSQAHNNLSGPIRPELGSLSNLERLDLSGNWLTGSIPAELGSLNSLEVLSLFGNLLTGSIPTELGGLGNLEELHLSYNQLTGSVPSELSNLSRLQELSLAGNQLTGAIPPELGNLDSLKTLELQGNRLTGSIPPELGNLELLEVLWLDDNDLSGPISAEFVRAAFLHDFYFGDVDGLPLPYLFADNNRLSGPPPAVNDSIPEDGRFFLSFISLAGNELTGSVPRLPAGDVRRNYFSGCIPLTWRLDERTPRLRVNPQRTSTGGTVNLKECASASGANAVTGPDGVAVREYLRGELRKPGEGHPGILGGTPALHRVTPIQSPIMDGQGLARAPAVGTFARLEVCDDVECPTAGRSSCPRIFSGR